MRYFCLINLLCELQHLEDALLGEGRGKDYGEIDERRHALTYGVLEGLDDVKARAMSPATYAY